MMTPQHFASVDAISACAELNATGASPEAAVSTR